MCYILRTQIPLVDARFVYICIESVVKRISEFLSMNDLVPYVLEMIYTL